MAVSFFYQSLFDTAFGSLSVGGRVDELVAIAHEKFQIETLPFRLVINLRRATPEHCMT